MPHWVKQKTENRERALALLCGVLALCLSACAASRPPDPSAPRSTEALYPVAITSEPARREAVLTAWTALTREQGITNAPVPELQPVTATVRSIPPLSNPLRLPKLGEGTPTTEEERTRESLRRFIISARALIGADPQQLSLIQRTDETDGTKRARYRQRPFRYPLRGGYGDLEISFTSDLRLLQMTSTCVPEVEQLQRAITNVRPRFTAEDVAKRMAGRSFTYTDAAGNQQAYTAAAGDTVNVTGLVIYPRLADGTTALEFHLAWEIIVQSNPARTLYLDAVSDDTLGVTLVPQS